MEAHCGNYRYNFVSAAGGSALAQSSRVPNDFKSNSRHQKHISVCNFREWTCSHARETSENRVFEKRLIFSKNHDFYGFLRIWGKFWSGTPWGRSQMTSNRVFVMKYFFWMQLWGMNGFVHPWNVQKWGFWKKIEHFWKNQLFLGVSSMIFKL